MDGMRKRNLKSVNLRKVKKDKLIGNIVRLKRDNKGFSKIFAVLSFVILVTSAFSSVLLAENIHSSVKENNTETDLDSNTNSSSDSENTSSYEIANSTFENQSDNNVSEINNSSYCINGNNSLSSENLSNTTDEANNSCISNASEDLSFNYSENLTSKSTNSSDNNETQNNSYNSTDENETFSADSSCNSLLQTNTSLNGSSCLLNTSSLFQGGISYYSNSSRENFSCGRTDNLDNESENKMNGSLQGELYQSNQSIVNKTDFYLNKNQPVILIFYSTSYPSVINKCQNLYNSKVGFIFQQVNSSLYQIFNLSYTPAVFLIRKKMGNIYTYMQYEKDTPKEVYNSTIKLLYDSVFGIPITEYGVWMLDTNITAHNFTNYKLPILLPADTSGNEFYIPSFSKGLIKIFSGSSLAINITPFNNSFFNISIPYISGAIKTTSLNQIQYIGLLYKTEVHPVKPQFKTALLGTRFVPYHLSSAGGVEYNITLNFKPSTNILSFPIQTKGLHFYYQPPLHPDHPTWINADNPNDTNISNATVYRPPEVVGSYAVYYNSSGDYSAVGGENYKTGKAFHIYRPKVVDANGNWIWVNLSVDKQNGTLKIIINNTWLQNAKYPLTIDPTFGYTSVGASTVSVRDDIQGLVAKPSYNGNLTNITVYIDGIPASCFSGDTKIRMENGSLKEARDIKEGDKVQYYDFKTHSIKVNKVLAVHHFLKDEFPYSYYLLVNNRLKITPPQILDKADGTHIKARDVKIGDILQGYHHPIRVFSVERVYKKIEIYDIGTRYGLFLDDFSDAIATDWFRLGVYLSSDLKAQTDNIPLNVLADPAWLTEQLLSSYLISAGTTYYLTAWAGKQDGADDVVYYDSGSTGDSVEAAYAYDSNGYPSPVSWNSKSYKLSIYGTYTNSPSNATNEYPASNSTGISLQPNCHVDVSDPDGDSITVDWYENTTGSWVKQQTNSSVSSGSTVYWTYTNASSGNTVYYWKVELNDGLNTADYIYHFTTTANAPPVINSIDLRNSTGSKLNQMIDVNEEYYFLINITDPDGWEDVNYINITAWYDNGNGSSYYNQTQGGNLNMFLQYKNITGIAEYKLIWPDDEVDIILDNCSETIINSTTREIKIAFKPKSQFRYAPGDGVWNNTQNTTDDLYSWNVNISVEDNSSARSWVKSEFGVYRYVNIQVPSSWIDVSALPGYYDDSDVVTIIFSSNYDYTLSIWFSTDLVNQSTGSIIPIANNVYILANADSNDDITTDTPFSGTGESNAIEIINQSGTFKSDGTSQTVNVQFRVYIPFGTLSGEYRANTITKIEQKS